MKSHEVKALKRREQIRKLCLDGLDNHEIAERIGMRADSVSAIRCQLGLSPGRRVSARA